MHGRQRGEVGGEFSLIARHFTWPSPSADLGVGDDAALLRIAAGMQLAVSTDLLVEGTHFLAGTDPGRLGHKSLA
ncbi:MAG: AIR synthase related protein, partial [bacterium]